MCMRGSVRLRRRLRLSWRAVSDCAASQTMLEGCVRLCSESDYAGTSNCTGVDESDNVVSQTLCVSGLSN
jgi:hypothetical protein